MLPMLKIDDIFGILLGMESEKLPHIGLLKIIATGYINMVKQGRNLLGDDGIENNARLTSNFMYNYPCRVLASTIKGKFEKK